MCLNPYTLTLNEFLTRINAVNILKTVFYPVNLNYVLTNDYTLLNTIKYDDKVVKYYILLNKPIKRILVTESNKIIALLSCMSNKTMHLKVNRNMIKYSISDTMLDYYIDIYNTDFNTGILTQTTQNGLKRYHKKCVKKALRNNIYYTMIKNNEITKEQVFNILKSANLL